MAKRPFFISSDKSGCFYTEENADFEFFSGFSISQKRLSINSLHSSILEKYPNSRILEVSRKSESSLGNHLSAFNLLYTLKNGGKVPLENAFQSSKKFEYGGPYSELLSVTPVEGKQYGKLKESGNLISFILEGEEWPLEPKTLFYDYIYISSLFQNKELCKQLLDYDIFTDIEFNPKKSFNCQARSVAICVSLIKQGIIEDFLSDKELFKRIYSNTKKEPIQTSLF